LVSLACGQIFVSDVHVGDWRTDQLPRSGNDWVFCECTWQDNRWFHLITDFQAVGQIGFPAEVLRPGSQAQQVVLREVCPRTTEFVVGMDSAVAFDPDELARMRAVTWSGQTVDLFTDLCPAGRVLKHLLCVLQFVIAHDVGAVTHHVNALHAYNKIMAFDCLETSVWPFAWEDLGRFVETFQAAASQASIDPGALLGAALQGSWSIDRSKLDGSNVAGRCAPLRDAQCWPNRRTHDMESCYACCHPQFGPGGHPSCFDAVWTAQRCCN